ncbi:12541_t:CDS:2, partial [Entrophospora sp. SA101]
FGLPLNRVDGALFGRYVGCRHDNENGIEIMLSSSKELVGVRVKDDVIKKSRERLNPDLTVSKAHNVERSLIHLLDAGYQPPHS